MKIDVSKLNQYQKSNLEDAIEAYNRKKLVSSNSPPVLYIELTQNCISRCPFCRGDKWVNSPAYNMKNNVFDILIKDYIPYAVLVDLRGWGESLMLPNFEEYVNKVAEFGPKIRLTTTLGTGTKKALQSLIDNNVFISVTFDFADKRLYEKTRKGVVYDTVIKNIEFITSELRKKGTLRENMRFAIAPLQKSNLDQVEKIINIANHYGVSEVVMSQLAASDDNRNLLKYHKRRTLRTMRKCVELAKKTGIRLQLARSPFEELYIEDRVFDRCCHPWLYSLVNYRGDLLLCDHMIGSAPERFAMGHITERKEKIWNGPKAQEARLNHIEKDIQKLPGKCRTCYAEGRYADHEHEICPQFAKWLVTEKEIENKLLTLKKKRQKLRGFLTQYCFKGFLRKKTD